MPSSFVRSFAIVALTFASLLPIAPAHAAPAIDAAGAATLKAVVDDALGFYAELKTRTGEGLTLDGDVTVVPKGAFYEVTIPGAKMASLTGTLDIGTVIVNATPEDNGDYRASIALPPQITLNAATGKQVMKIDLGTQKFSGIFRPSLGVFTTADAVYNDVSATLTPPGDSGLPQQPIVISIAKLASRITMQPDGALWSGPQTSVISNAVMTFGDKGASRISFDELKAAVTYDKIDLGMGKKLRDDIRAAIKNTPAGDKAAFEKNIARLLGNAQAIPENVTSAFAMTNAAFEISGAPKTTDTASKPLTLRIATLTSDGTATSLNSDTGGVSSKIRLTGLSVNGHEGPLTGLIPNEAALNVTAEKLPFKSIFATLATAVNNVIDSAETASPEEAEKQAQINMAQATAAIPALLAKAGSTLTVSDSYSRAADLSSTLGGALTATEGTPYGFAGTMTLALTGMDELIAKLQQISRNSNDPSAAGYAQLLIIMQLSGQYTKTPEGISQRSYAVEMARDGKILLNGVDMQSLLNTGAAPKP